MGSSYDFADNKSSGYPFPAGGVPKVGTAVDSAFAPQADKVSTAINPINPDRVGFFGMANIFNNGFYPQDSRVAPNLIDGATIPQETINKLEFLDRRTGTDRELKVPEVKTVAKGHSHYYKDVSHLKTIDVYQVLYLFGVTDPCLQHLIKKALCAGNRGHKDYNKDLKDIYDTAKRMLEILEENSKT